MRIVKPRRPLRNIPTINCHVSLHREMNSRRRATVSEDESQKARQARQEAEAGRHLAEKERQEKAAESLGWREKHQDLVEKLRAQEDMKALRQSKAVRRPP